MPSGTWTVTTAVCGTTHDRQPSRETAPVGELPILLHRSLLVGVAFTGITGLLRRRALVRVGPDSLQVHRLVQTILRDSPIRALDHGGLTTIAHQLLWDAVPVDPWNNPPSWPAWRQLLPHVLAVIEPVRYPDPDSPDVPWLLDRAATYLLTQGEPRPARTLFEYAHHLYRNILGEDHPDTLRAANNLAIDLSELSGYQRARELAENTLAQCRRVLAEDHPETQESADNLAADLRALGEHEKPASWKSGSNLD